MTKRISSITISGELRNRQPAETISYLSGTKQGF